MSETQTVENMEHKQESPAAAAVGGDSIPFPLKVILGQKVGMTRIFTEQGVSVPVSVIYTGSCLSTDVRTKERDGYEAVQLGFGVCEEKDLSKPHWTQFQKKNLPARKWLKEFRVSDASKFKIGQAVGADLFSPGDYVDVSGVTIGKGFAGPIKRHNFRGLPTSHGASDKVRSRGSSGGGSGQPQRVLKGTRMAGRLGGDWVTIQKLEVVRVDKERSLLMLKGAVPGISTGLVVVRETSRRLKHKRAPIIKKSAKKAANVAPKKSGAAAAAAKAKPAA